MCLEATEFKKEAEKVVERESKVLNWAELVLYAQSTMLYVVLRVLYNPIPIRSSKTPQGGAAVGRLCNKK